MKKKNLTTMVAGAIALGAGLVASPSGEQVIEQAAQQANSIRTEVQAKTNTARTATAQQQAQQQTSHRYSAPQSAMYLPYRDGYGVYGKFSVSPREYGEYLARSGKNKRNLRHHKKLARCFA